MNKVKSGIFTAIIMGLLGALLFLMWDWQLRAFWTLALILAAVGFIATARVVYWLLAWDGPERAATPPWELPMEEADAAAWEGQ